MLITPLPPAPPAPREFLQCPLPMGETQFGVCVQECSSDRNCSAGMLCCSNGCGNTCQRGDSIPYYDIPFTCPAVTDFVSICLFDEDSCIADNECDSDEVCCPDGCGSVCEEPVESSTPCLSIRDALDSTDELLVGVFRPNCLSDGSFSSIQCHGSSCWCVHTQTGLPLSRRTPISDNLTCTSE